jgi:hypothetical protein
MSTPATTDAARTPAEVVRTYGEVWDDLADEDRRARLDACWAPDGEYLDPTAHVVGREALAAHVAGFHARMPGHRMVLSSGVDEHHGRVRFAWRLLGPDGAQLLEGTDFGELGEDGRLRRIVGFFGPLR